MSRQASADTRLAQHVRIGWGALYWPIVHAAARVLGELDAPALDDHGQRRTLRQIHLAIDLLALLVVIGGGVDRLHEALVLATHVVDGTHEGLHDVVDLGDDGAGRRSGHQDHPLPACFGRRRYIFAVLWRDAAEERRSSWTWRTFSVAGIGTSSAVGRT